MMCKWMGENRMLIDFDDDRSDVLVDSRIVRYRTLDVMFHMLEESSTAGGSGGGGHKIYGAANTIGYIWMFNTILLYLDAAVYGLRE